MGLDVLYHIDRITRGFLFSMFMSALLILLGFNAEVLFIILVVGLINNIWSANGGRYEDKFTPSARMSPCSPEPSEEKSYTEFQDKRSK